jgi:hypothetical protein
VLGPLGLEPDQLAVELPAILVVHRGDADHRPGVLLAAVPADEHRDQLGRVEAVGLGAALAAIDFDRGRVDHEVPDPFLGQEAMEPEAVAAGFIAGDHRGVDGQAEPLFGPLDLEADPDEAAGGQRAEPGLLAGARGEGQLPGAPAQLEGQVEHRSGRCGSIGRVGR